MSHGAELVAEGGDQVTNEVAVSGGSASGDEVHVNCTGRRVGGCCLSGCLHQPHRLKDIRWLDGGCQSHASVRLG